MQTNGWVSGLTSIFDSVTKNITSVWTTINNPGVAPVQSNVAPPPSPQSQGMSTQTLILIGAAAILAVVLLRK